MLRLIVLLLFASSAWAAGPSLKVGPDVILLEGDEGDIVTQQITLANPGAQAIPVRLEAVNWVLDENSRRVYEPKKAQLDDCRGWWPAGFADLLIQPGQAVNHDIEIHIPDEIDDERECRFALAVRMKQASDGQALAYVPLYLNVEGAEPELEFEGFALKKEGTLKQPMVVLRNEGTAHARVFGMFRGEDTQGQVLDLVVRTTEILPGETRGVPLLVSKKGGGEAWWSAPVRVEGKLIWEDDDMEIEGMIR